MDEATHRPIPLRGGVDGFVAAAGYFARTTIVPPVRVDVVVIIAKLRNMSCQHISRVFLSAQA